MTDMFLSSFPNMKDSSFCYPEVSGFTLIELLIVVTIISIIGVASISGFSHMAESQDAQTTMRTIGKALDMFDQDVSRYRITSYDAVFKSGSVGFAADLDSYKKTLPLQYSYDFATGSGEVQSNTDSA